MYPAELEIKDTTESTTSASYLDLLLSIGRDGQLHTSIYDKRDDFSFHITNFSFLSSYILSSPAYGVFISQLIRYARACFSFECFILRARRLSSKLLKQGYLVERLKSSFWKYNGRYGDLIQQYEVSLKQMLIGILILDQQWLPTNQTFHQFHDHDTDFDLHWIMSGFHGAIAMADACQQGTLTLPDTWFRPSILGLACAQIVETRFLELAMPLLDFSPLISLGIFSILPSDIYPMERRLNKANTSDKEISFLDLNIKVFWQWCSYQCVRQSRWFRIKIEYTS